MPTILHIETSGPVCSVALSSSADDVSLREVIRKNSHSEVITTLVEDLLKEKDLQTSNLDAVAISAGPGSYTGLRIGLSTAKGICYALSIPLIAVGTLQAMAWAMAKKIKNNRALYCPMIDARRMEVYTALFDVNNHEKRSPYPLELKNNHFIEILNNQEVIFFGDGMSKCVDLLDHKNAKFEIQPPPSAMYMVDIAYNYLNINKFEDVAYFEPRYLKAFWTPNKKN